MQLFNPHTNSKEYESANIAEDLNLMSTNQENPAEEGDWDDEEDEDFDDQMESENDMHEIRVDDDLGEPDPEEDDHLPEEELQ
jgi:hypothetical protein